MNHIGDEVSRGTDPGRLGKRLRGVAMGYYQDLEAEKSSNIGVFLIPRQFCSHSTVDHNGNIQHLVDASTKTIAATYMYSPFGVLIGESGTAKDSCPFRFQSKYYDRETELYYYGYRYYDARTCKWLSRDPKGESGGINLTAFCGNDPVNKRDYLGLEDVLLLLGPDVGLAEKHLNIKTGRWTGTARSIAKPNQLLIAIEDAQREVKSETGKDVTLDVRWVYSAFPWEAVTENNSPRKGSSRRKGPLTAEIVREESYKARMAGTPIIVAWHGLPPELTGEKETTTLLITDLTTSAKTRRLVSAEAFTMFEAFVGEGPLWNPDRVADITVYCCYAGGLPENVGPYKIRKGPSKEYYNEKVTWSGTRAFRRQFIDRIKEILREKAAITVSEQKKP